ncbi:MAG: FAD/NAD(P)-binding protein [Cypionkella sp.]
MPARRVAIIGGGFSGAMAAVNLARFRGPPATIIERAGVFGPGVAFGGRDRGQVLNVRAGNMSAYPDDPGHFERWLGSQGHAESGFAKRTDYGRYLAREIETIGSAAPGAIARIAQEAVSAQRHGGGWRVRCSGGSAVEADVLILASGLAPPATPPELANARLPRGKWIADPWREDFTVADDPRAPVLLIGTGLTMVDVAITLAEQRDAPPIHALSRRGLLPRAHSAPAPTPRLAETPNATLASLVSFTRKAAGEIGWRGAIDRLRPHTRAIWQRLDTAERKRFLRHLRPFWDVHRHRMAPELAERIEGLIADGALTVHAGRLENAVMDGGRIRVSWQVRGTAARVAFDFDRIVNCTGPAPLDGASAGPLIAGLLAEGHLVRDEMGLGVEVDAQSRALDASGRAQNDLFALGALTRGSFWEISAVPDIRVQAWDVARRLANAHWVGGEGL